jgi:hypothetical protein
MRLAAALSRHKILFNYRPGHVRLVMDRMALGQTVLQYFGFPLLLYGTVIRKGNGHSLKAFQQDRCFFGKKFLQVSKVNKIQLFYFRVYHN